MANIFATIQGGTQMIPERMNERSHKLKAMGIKRKDDQLIHHFPFT